MKSYALISLESLTPYLFLKSLFDIFLYFKIRRIQFSK